MENGKPYHETNYRLPTGCGNLYVTVVRDDSGKIITVFSSIGKAGGCVRAQSEVVCRLVTKAIENGATIDDVAHSLIGTQCNMVGYFGSHVISSCADAMGKVLSIAHNLPEETDIDSALSKLFPVR